MIRKVYAVLALCICVSALLSCDVDFDPNGEYKEQMMVYCVLDKNSDTTFVRIERCFLGGANYAKNKDSLYYDEQDLDVRMYAYTLGDTVNSRKEFVFSFGHGSNKEDGLFYSGNDSPIYYCRTKDELKQYPFYRLVIKNLKTGLVVSASTYMVSDVKVKTTDMRFRNAGDPTVSLDDEKQIMWEGYTGENVAEKCKAKYFLVKIRFNFGKDGTTNLDYIDIPIAKRTVFGNTDRDNSVPVTIGYLINNLKEGFNKKNQTNIRITARQNFVISVSACNKDMTDYIMANNSSESELNYKPVFTNIVNGYGLFASRTYAEQYIDRNNVDNNFWIELSKIISTN